MQCDLAAQAQILHTHLNTSYVAAISYQNCVLLIIKRVTARKKEL